MFKVNQKVWCAIYGAGVVEEILHASEGVHPVVVRCKGTRLAAYTSDGKYHVEGNVTLFPYPVEIVKATSKPSIDWSHVSENFQYLAMDEEGLHYLFAEKPEPVVLEWAANGRYIPAGHFASFSAGTCHWSDSLVKRPN